MVEKADGSWRPCEDFQRLNLVTKLDSYPLPNMLDFDHVAKGCTIFSKIDLRKGYHQIPVHPDNICKTAISTPFVLVENTRMPFGLRNAGNTFQRKIDRVKNQLKFCLPKRIIWRLPAKTTLSTVSISGRCFFILHNMG
jgi:hypothetical protein